MQNIYPNDRDYFFGEDGSIFQVIGYLHPKDSIYCLKKYIPIEKKKSGNFYWFSLLSKKYYQRNILSYSSKTAEENINSSDFKKFSKLYGAYFISYPMDKIKNYLHPKKRLKKIYEDFLSRNFEIMKKLKDQEKSAIAITSMFEDILRISIDDIGMTGSSLWLGLHKYSDIDIIIYGIKNTLNFINNSEKLLEIQNTRLRKLNYTEMFDIANKFSMKTGLDIEDCVVYISLKKYLFYYGKHYLSIAFCPTTQEIKENPLGNQKTQFLNVNKFKNITIRARVKNTDWAYFYPALVEIDSIEIVFPNNKIVKELKLIQNIKRILIFERESSGYFNNGTKIEIRGLLQEIKNPSPYFLLKNALGNINALTNEEEVDSKYYQITIGTKENYRNEYIKNLEV